MSEVREHLERVKGRIADAAERAGRAPEDITLVAVSKRQPDEKLLEAYAAGQRDFGENYVQELERKRSVLPPDARWHQIGHVQTNKARKVVRCTKQTTNLLKKNLIIYDEIFASADTMHNLSYSKA